MHLLPVYLIAPSSYGSFLMLFLTCFASTSLFCCCSASHADGSASGAQVLGLL